MCVILIGHKVVANMPLLVLANHDDYTDRASLYLDPLHHWPMEDVVAGRDRYKQINGSYLAMHRKTGRFAVMTIVRQLLDHPPPSSSTTPATPTTPALRPVGGHSRGRLVIDFCTSEEPVETYRETTLERNEALYDSYSLIYGSLSAGFYYYSNHAGFTAQMLQPGVWYGLSNGNLEAAWPKVQRGKSLLHQALQQHHHHHHSDPTRTSSGHDDDEEEDDDAITDDELFEILKDDWRPDDDDTTDDTDTTDPHHPPKYVLPDTGVGKTTERFLSSIFIPSYFYNYGTVASTIVRVNDNGNVKVVERTFRHDEESEYTYCAEQSFRL